MLNPEILIVSSCTSYTGKDWCMTSVHIHDMRIRPQLAQRENVKWTKKKPGNMSFDIHNKHIHKNMSGSFRIHNFSCMHSMLVPLLLLYYWRGWWLLSSVPAIVCFFQSLYSLEAALSHGRIPSTRPTRVVNLNICFILSFSNICPEGTQWTK